MGISFAVARSKIRLTEKIRKNNFKIAQNGFPSPTKPPAYLMSQNQGVTKHEKTFFQKKTRISVKLIIKIIQNKLLNIFFS